jgi:hypothetical protein
MTFWQIWNVRLAGTNDFHCDPGDFFVSVGRKISPVR